LYTVRYQGSHSYQPPEQEIAHKMPKKDKESKPLLESAAPISYTNGNSIGTASGKVEPTSANLDAPKSPTTPTTPSGRAGRSTSLGEAFKKLTHEDRTHSLQSCGSYTSRTLDVAFGKGVITTPDKTISFLGSLSLISNNTTGPAMMGLPFLVLKAGIIPVVGSIIVCAVLTSLMVTMMSDAVSSLPRNKNFDRPITFATAFRLIAGKRWAAAVELLFLMSCMVQACAALVETAQSLDGFIASFIVGKSYALQIAPEIRFISWDASTCDKSDDDASGCVPFAQAGSLIMTLGFVIATCIFLPFGLGHLKETIIVQILSFLCLFVLLGSFYYEFFSHGFPNWSSLRWFGGDYSQLAGVVLFNYAFSITVPSWLNEKKKDVSVNQVSSYCVSYLSYLTDVLAL
jgi:amino acid permease